MDISEQLPQYILDDYKQEGYGWKILRNKMNFTLAIFNCSKAWLYKIFNDVKEKWSNIINGGFIF